MFYKDIICLANSRKWKQRCFAGKDISTKNWIRPVSDHDRGAISEKEMDLGGALPQILDIIRVPLKQDSKTYYQPENILIESKQWKKIGFFPIEKIEALCDNPDLLWINEPYRDRIPVSLLKISPVASSLLLIKPERIKIERHSKKIRAVFTYKKIEYDLGVTDIYIERQLDEKRTETLTFEKQVVYLCISLGEPFRPDYDPQEYCYKLVATLISVPEAKT